MPSRVIIIIVIVVMIIAFIASLPWLSLSLMLFGYLLSIPLSLRAHKRYEAGEEFDEDIEEDTEDLEPV